MKDFEAINKELNTELDSIKKTVKHHEEQRNYVAANNWYQYQLGVERAIWLINYSKRLRAKNSK